MQDLISDATAFCCSFQLLGQNEASHEIFSQTSHIEEKPSKAGAKQEPAETSAFADMVEEDMEEEKKGSEKEEAEILEAKTRAKVNALTARFSHTHIDFKAA